MCGRLGPGGRTPRCCTRATKAYWPIEVDYGANTCEPLDVLKHLTAERVQKAPA